MNVFHQPGVQLWSLKNDLAKDTNGTLNALARAGVSDVEAAGYDTERHTLFGQEPGKFLEKLKAAGLRLVSLHAGLTIENSAELLKQIAASGIKYLIGSMYPDPQRALHDYKKIAGQYNTLGRITAAQGIQFGYHNHHFEFEPVGGIMPFEILLSETDPQWVVFEADLGWMVQSGQDPVDWFAKYPGRFPLWHLRDVDAEGASVAAGSGRVDFATIGNHAVTAGFQYGFIETPSAATDGLEKVMDSYRYFVSNPHQ